MENIYWLYIILGIIGLFILFEAGVWCAAKARTIRKYYTFGKLLLVDREALKIAYSISREIGLNKYAWNRNKLLAFEEKSTLYKARKIENNLYEFEISLRVGTAGNVEYELTKLCEKIIENENLGDMAWSYKGQGIMLKVRPNFLPPAKTIYKQDIPDAETHARWQ